MNVSPFAPLPKLPEIDWLELGRQVATDPTFSGFERQGRPLTNAEMEAARLYRRKQTDELLEDL